MKNYDEIISRFDEIQVLPISEEMFGAYLEGNLDCYEMESISKLVQKNDLLRTISEDVICSSTNLNHIDDLLDIGMENDTVSLEAGRDAPIGTGCSMLYSDENIIDNESYIEDYESIDNNDSIEDSLLDYSSFELPEIPFF